MVKFRRLLFITSSVLLAVFLSIPVAASSEPYYGKDYSQPEQVLELYPNPDADFGTPAFTTDGRSFTSQEQMMDFVRELEEENSFIEMTIIGESIEGREIPMLAFKKGNNPNQKPTVWIHSQIHGNEPASGETALVMANKLANEYGQKLLEKINVIIVPRVNVDGSYHFQRENVIGLDLNRDHTKLESPETQAIHKAFNDIQPEVSIVGHEYGIKHNSQLFKDIGEQGSLAYHDILLQSGRNLGIPDQIRDMSFDLFISNASEKLTERGFSNDTYYTVAGRNKDGQLIINEPTYGADRGPSNLGLQPAISFITETRGIGIGRESFERRVASAVTAQMSILETTAKNPKMVKKVVENARKETVKKGRKKDNDDKIAVTMKRKQMDDQDFTVTDIATGDAADLNVVYLSSTEAIPTLERVRPTKYIMPPEYDELAEKFELMGIDVAKTKMPLKLEMETYTVTDKEVDEREFEGVHQSHVETEVISKEVDLPEGSYVYSMAQPTANKLPVTLEPESPASFVTWDYIPSEVGETLPIYRFMQQRALPVEPN
ncbi:M14 family metallocarboxypeptidase [Lentibacillus sp. CBA3610]|uniref:M14 family metallopeptidase n=1 Tax=Lentibacillus sp. CBA3610 TaxID=2518176 RepID=UPI0015957A88|nr:M14 family metallocarboxypeptidase [Lentibacillus sp. CBA3610]QKY69351.1 peptidase M14 [Lentibacillus sp. CBA3610]